ncbi:MULTISPECIES: DoxX family membrane protein [Thermomonosporaceae]|uniref:DoxX family membrane protein n=1 Tax=Thermomonosporaceae TaxID=2012 RepID=UPI00255A8FD5|nr:MULTISPECIES: DoxX family membrane protein [Thermomonosporaceae]MDL4771988.1 DoxX family membrane protein [Actinomadura xylanilytica]
MRPITTLARPFVAAPYIITGLETLRDPTPRAEQVAPTLKPIVDRLDWLPTKDPETLVRIEGALSLGTGALLMAGKFRRLTTLLLAAQLVPALATEHRYWTEDDPERRNSERSHLLKNAGLFGALLMVATEPRHVSRRAPRAADLRRQTREVRIRAGAETKALRRETAAEIRNARREAARQVRDVRREGSRRAALGTAKASKGAAKVSMGAAKAGQSAGKGAAKAGKGATKAARAVRTSKAGKAARSSFGR